MSYLHETTLRAPFHGTQILLILCLLTSRSAEADPALLGSDTQSCWAVLSGNQVRVRESVSRRAARSSTTAVAPKTRLSQEMDAFWPIRDSMTARIDKYGYRGNRTEQAVGKALRHDFGVARTEIQVRQREFRRAVAESQAPDPSAPSTDSGFFSENVRNLATEIAEGRATVPASARNALDIFLQARHDYYALVERSRNYIAGPLVGPVVSAKYEQQDRLSLTKAMIDETVNEILGVAQELRAQGTSIRGLEQLTSQVERAHSAIDAFRIEVSQRVIRTIEFPPGLDNAAHVQLVNERVQLILDRELAMPTVRDGDSSLEAGLSTYEGNVRRLGRHLEELQGLANELDSNYAIGEVMNTF